VQNLATPNLQDRIDALQADLDAQRTRISQHKGELDFSGEAHEALAVAIDKKIEEQKVEFCKAWDA